jgi:hypothetical protein
MTPGMVLEQYFEAWRRGDAKALEALLAPDVHATGPLATVTGAAAHAASLARSASLFRAIAVEQMVVDGQMVITWFAFHLPDGQCIAACNRCEVAGDLITRVQVVFDPRPLVASTSRERPRP